jgi:SAM-dependent methyltransferase
MDFEILKEQWLQEENIAHIHGWDFSHIHGRYEEGRDIPWNYEAIVRRFLLNSSKLLDIDTGGGEFLLGLNHPYQNTSATEGYPPNVALCKTILLPLGIDFRETTDVRQLPFSDSLFDMVINRHGSFSAEELFRVLKPNGLFITQQVGAKNDRELVELLLPNTRIPYPEQYLEKAIKKFTNAGFEILESQEAFPKIKFYDVGALVWFARIIEWEFPGFSVDKCFHRLCKVQELLNEKGVIEASTHRFLLVTKKPAQIG